MVSRVTTTARLNKEDGFQVSITIPNSSVLTLNTIGYTLLTAPTNVQLCVEILDLVVKITSGTPYTSVHSMTVGYGPPLAQTTIVSTIPGIGFLDQSVPTGVIAVRNGVSSMGYIINQTSGQISMVMGTSNPANGTSPISVSMKYRTHKLA